MDEKLARTARYLEQEFARIRETHASAPNVAVAAAQVQAALAHAERVAGQHRERCLAAWLLAGSTRAS